MLLLHVEKSKLEFKEDYGNFIFIFRCNFSLMSLYSLGLVLMTIHHSRDNVYQGLCSLNDNTAE